MVANLSISGSVFDNFSLYRVSQRRNVKFELLYNFPD